MLFNGDAGDNAINGTSGDDEINGFAGRDILNGQEGNDQLTGGPGVDVIRGEAGSDTSFQNLSTDGVDFVNLGLGMDTAMLGRDNVDPRFGAIIRLSFAVDEVGNASFTDSGTRPRQDGGLAVRVDLGNSIFDGGTFEPSRYDDEGTTFLPIIVASNRQIYFSVYDPVTATDYGRWNIVVLGSSDADTINLPAPSVYGSFAAGGNGADVINGNSRADYLNGGAGNDILTGYDGDDTLIGGAGVDVVRGEEGDDVAYQNLATDGVDFVNLGNGSDRVILSGVDRVRLTFAANEVGNASAVDANSLPNETGELAVRVRGADAGGNLLGENSFYDDEFTDFSTSNGAAIDVYELTTGMLVGTFDIVHLGDQGVDSINRTSSTLRVYANGGAGNDFFIGGNRDDVLIGGAGQDRLEGGSGNDLIIGGDGRDQADGQGGDDIIVTESRVGGVPDSVTGGLGADMFRFLAPSGVMTAPSAEVEDFRRAQGDRIDLDAIFGGELTFIGTAAFSRTAGELRVTGDAGNQTVSADLNGDGVADFLLLVRAADVLTAPDFVL